MAETGQVKHLFGAFEKVEKQGDGSVKVRGPCSTPDEDADGETISADAMRKAIGPWITKWGNIRESHDPHKAAGVALAAAVDDATGYTHLEAHIVDKDTVAKITCEPPVLRGFSVRGIVPPGGRDAKNPRHIEAIDIVEVSVVDRPANEACRFEVFKAGGASPSPPDVSPAASASAGVANGKDQPMAEAAPTAAAAPVLDPPSLATFVQAGGDAFTSFLRQHRDPIAKALAGMRQAEFVEKAQGAAKAAGKDTIEKGMYAAARAAELFQELSWLHDSCVYESAAEEDESPVPGMLFEALSKFGDALKAMVVEEIDEELADETTEKSAGALNRLAAPLHALGEVAKGAKAARKDEIQKAGARFSAGTKKALQAHHDELQKCHDAMGKAHEQLGEVAKAFGDMGWKDGKDEKDGKAKDDGAAAKEKASDVGEVEKALGAARAEKDEIAKTLAAAQAKADELTKAAGAAAARADELEKTLAAVRTEKDEVEKTVGLATSALEKVIGERDQAVKTVAGLNQKLADKGLLRQVPIEVEKTADGKAPGAEDDKPGTTQDEIKKAHRHPRAAYAF